MKNAKYFSITMLVLGLFLGTSQTAQADFVGTMQGSATGGATLLPTTPSPGTSTDTTLVDASLFGATEFEASLTGNYLGIPSSPSDIDLTFDFFNNVGLSFLDIYGESGSDQWEFSGVTVTFENWSRDDGFVLTGVTSSDFVDGLTWEILSGGEGLKLIFGDFESDDYGRSIELELEFGTGPSAPVVPVPPASLLVLLGMCGIALKRRFA